MDLKKAFTTDKDKEQNGVWVEIGKGAKLKIARANNPDFLRRFRRLTKPYTRAIRTGTMDEAVGEKILIDCMAHAVLLDWEGIEENGKPVKYSVEKAKEFLQIKDFRDLVSSLADDMELFKAEEDEELEKN